MTPPSMDYIRDLSPREIFLLTQVLRSSLTTPNTPFTPPDLASFIASFPMTLLRPTSLLPRLIHHLSPQDRAVLCPLHKPLDPHLIRRLYLQLTQEVTLRIARLEEHPVLPPHLAAFMNRLHAVNSLWMSPSLFSSAYPHIFPEQRHERVDSGCEACILSLVGGNGDILRDLRASMVGRKKRGRPVPRFLKVVEGWMGWLGDGERVLEWSEGLGREVRGVRRQLQLARRQVGRNLVEGIAVDNGERDFENGSGNTVGGGREEEERNEKDAEEVEEEDVEQGHDFENSIINEYCSRFSRNLPPDAQEKIFEETTIHSAFRNFFAFDHQAGRYIRSEQQTQIIPEQRSARLSWLGVAHAANSNSRQRQPTVSSEYSASIYSGDQESIQHASGWRSAEDLAEEYSELLPKRDA